MHPALAIMLHPSHGSDPDDSEPMDGDGPSKGDGKEGAAKALIAAVHAKDAEKVTKALEMFCDIHASPDEEEPEDGEEEK